MEGLKVRNDATFYTATNRKRITCRSREHTKNLYTFNYSKILPISKDSHIVDLGCSEGIGMEWLLGLGYHNLSGVDSDPVAIDVARQKLNGLLPLDRLIVGDILEFTHRQYNSTIEFFLMNNIIEHLNKTYVVKLAGEIRRVLKPGGSLLIQTGNMENPFNFGLFARDFTHEIPFTSNSLRQLMIMAGFSPTMIEVRPVRYKTTLRNYPLQILSPIMGWLIKGVALSMRMRILETAPLIYCLARKHT